jgi:hypothetical protein
MVTMRALPAQSLFLVRYSGDVPVREVEESLGQVTGLLAQLTPGFSVLADLTDLTSMDVKCAPYIEKVMDLCQQHGVSDIVRVIPDPRRDIGMQIMSQFHYDKNVHISTCSSLAEATKLLGVTL